MQQAYLNIQEAANYLGKSRMTIYRMIDRGLKVTTAAETRRLIKISDLEEFLYGEEEK